MPTTPLKPEHLAYLENDDDGHERATAHTQPQKRLRLVTTRKPVVHSVPQLPIRKRKVVLKSDEEDTPSRKRRTEPGPWLRSLKAQGQPPVAADQPPLELPIFLHVPYGDGKFRYVSIDDIPMTVHAELLKRYTAFRIATLHKTRAHRVLSNDPATYIDKAFCVCDQITQGLKTVRTLAVPTYTMGGQIKLRADDKCIRDRIPCAHLIKRDDEYALCFVPLPMKAQESEKWKELGFWVHE